MLGSILIFLLILSVLILVHELGHFIVARKTGVLVEEFGFGLPPRLVGVNIGETTYSLNLFPFGGFVRLYGEDSAKNLPFPKHSFSGKNKRTRFAIVFAGVVMNFLLAVFAFSLVYSFSGIPRETKNVKVVEIASGSPAQVGGILVGDIVRKVDKIEITSVKSFVEAVEVKKGKRIVLETDKKKITLMPRANPPEGEGPLGVVISTTEVYYPPLLLRPFYGIYHGFGDAFFWGKTVLTGLTHPKDIAGPIGIFAVTSEASKFGILALINLMGILSVNLAVLNVLPIPALDGGRLLFIGLEGLVGKKILPKVEATVHTIGMVLLLTLLLAVSAYDLLRLIKAGSLSGFIQSVVK